MKLVFKFLFAAAFFFARFDPAEEARAADTPTKIRIGYPSAAVSTLPFDIAKEKRFYQKAGVDVEAIQMRSAIGPQAVLNGNINFFTSPQVAINAAVAGLPLVVVLSLYRDTPWVLVTTKEIAKAQDLVGKNQPPRGRRQRYSLGFDAPRRQA